MAAATLEQLERGVGRFSIVLNGIQKALPP
jgi:hypothetical protein